VIASVIKDLEMIAMLNARLVPDAQAVVTPGDAMARMRLNGRGFANRPLSLTPQFVANKPLARLFREGIRAAMLNRFQLGRTLDEAYTYGCDLLFHALALAVCVQEGIALRFNHLDPTSLVLPGEYVPDSDEQAMTLTYGYAKDHRPDLTHAVLERMVAQAGGVPLGSKRWDGHTSEIKICQERAPGLLAAFQKAPSPRSLMADSTLYQEDHAPTLHTLGVITRLPHTLNAVWQVSTQALAWGTWHRFDAEPRDQCLELCHDGMAQRGLIIQSDAALERAEATRTKAHQREETALTKQLFHLQATRFQTAEAAQDALAALAQRWTYHLVASSTLSAHKRYVGNGRPTSHPPLKAIAGQIQAQVRPDQEVMRHHQPSTACFVLGTTIGTSALSDAAVSAAYKGQSSVDGGCRLRKDPLFVVAAVFVKKPSRIEGLLLVMTLALLGYAVAQRRMRQPLARQAETLPNPINQPTMAPTVRWVFQLLDGIHGVRVTVQGQVHERIEGLNDVKINILRLFGARVCCRYQISPGEGAQCRSCETLRTFVRFIP
jgi:transposase